MSNIQTNLTKISGKQDGADKKFAEMDKIIPKIQSDMAEFKGSLNLKCNLDEVTNIQRKMQEFA
jgi:ABC-type Fe3+-hydroxamate transport system substrate-binding protein